MIYIYIITAPMTKYQLSVEEPSKERLECPQGGPGGLHASDLCPRTQQESQEIEIFFFGSPEMKQETLKLSPLIKSLLRSLVLLQISGKSGRPIRRSAVHYHLGHEQLHDPQPETIIRPHVVHLCVHLFRSEEYRVQLRGAIQ